MKKIYGVELSQGTYDDYVSCVQFVSEDKEYVEKWVAKYNRVLSKLKEYFNEKYEQYADEYVTEDENIAVWLDKYYRHSEKHEAQLTEIEIR